MFKLIVFNQTPPNQWKYLVPETGKWVPDASKVGSPTMPAYGDLVDAVKAHYKANQVSVPPDIDQLIQDQCCRSIPGGGFCEDEKGRRRTATGGFMFDVSTVLQGTRTLADWLLTGRQRVTDEEAMSRARICAICSFNQNPAGCSSCGGGGLKSMVDGIVAGNPLPTDSLLKSCTVCGCSLVAKTRIPKDTLLRHMSKEQLNDLPGHCWLKL